MTAVAGTLAGRVVTGAGTALRVDGGVSVTRT